MTNVRKRQNIRWLIGFAVYLLIGGVAAAVVTWYGLWIYSTPFLFVFILGYLAGRITKVIER